MAGRQNIDYLIEEAPSIPFSGWDFPFLSQRWKTNQTSWDYIALARALMVGIASMLDQDRGGGEVNLQISMWSLLPQY